MSIVYVVQMPHIKKWDGKLVPQFDTSPANMFGRVVEILKPSLSPFEPQTVLRELNVQLEDFCDDDWLLLIGNPILISMAFAIAADVNDGRVRVLQWHGKRREYTPVEIDMDWEFEEEKELPEEQLT